MLRNLVHFKLPFGQHVTVNLDSPRQFIVVQGNQTQGSWCLYMGLSQTSVGKCTRTRKFHAICDRGYKYSSSASRVMLPWFDEKINCWIAASAIWLIDWPYERSIVCVYIIWLRNKHIWESNSHKCDCTMLDSCMQSQCNTKHCHFCWGSIHCFE